MTFEYENGWFVKGNGDPVIFWDFERSFGFRATVRDVDEDGMARIVDEAGHTYEVPVSRLWLVEHPND